MQRNHQSFGRCRFGRSAESAGTAGRRRTRVFGIRAATLAIALGSTGVLSAATFLWDGGAGVAAWSSANNWNPNGAPAPGTGHDYQFGGGVQLTSTADGATPWSVNSITFLNTAGNFTVSSSTTLNLGATGIINNDTGTQTISAPIALQANSALTATSGQIVLSGAISGSNFGFTKTGSRNVTFSGTTANTYTGVTTVGVGTLNLSKTAGVVAIAGNIVIGDGGGTDVLRTTTANQISATSALTFTTGGVPTFNLNSTAQQVGSIASVNASSTISLGSANLTVGAANTSTSFAGTLAGSTGGLIKVGTGNLTLTNAGSTFQGQLQVRDGAVSISSLTNATNNSQIGRNATIVLGNLTTTGTLQYTGAGHSVNRGLNLGGTTGGGTLEANGAGALALSGAVTSGGAGSKTLTLTGTSTAANTLSGVISNNSGVNLTSILKSGTGNWSLTNAASTYTGSTTVAGGNLSVSALANGGANSSIGAATSAASNIVLDGGTLNYTGGAVSTDRLFSVGNSGGTLVSAGSGTLTFSNIGALGFNGETGARTLTLAGSNNGSLAAVIGDNSGATAVTKNGTGTWSLAGSGSNTYTGTTTVNEGTLALNKSGGATAVAGSLLIGNGAGTDTVRLDAANQISDSAAVTLGAGGTPVLNLNGFSERIGSLASANASAQVQLGTPGAATAFTVGDSTSTTYAGTFTSGNSNPSLVKEGTGTLNLSGASAGFTGGATVNAGTLNLQSNNALGIGTVGTTVTSGATLQIDGGRLTTSNGNLSLAGTGASGTGALVGSAGNNRWDGNITLTGNTTIGTSGSGYLALGITSTGYNRVDFPILPTDTTTLSLGGHTLTLNGTTSAGDNAAIYANTRITGTGNVVINMTNTADQVVYTANLNSYTGTTTIQNGTLNLSTLIANTSPNDPDPQDVGFYALNGPIVIGDATGAAGSAKLLVQAGSLYTELINNTVSLTILRDGVLNLLSDQTADNLILTGGAVDLGSTGGLYLNGDVTVNASSGNTATIIGTGTSTLSLTVHQATGNIVANADRIFNVVGGAGNTSDLTVSAVINNGSLTKNGAGTMTITGTNTGGYEGTTTVNNGILSVQNNAALGQANGLADTATTVNTGGTLQLSNVANGNLTVSGEKLTLSGTGFDNNGALQSLAGNNTWAGTAGIALAADATIKSVQDTFTISTAITSSSSTLTVAGAGNTTISGAIGTNSGGLIKNDAGTLLLSGNNNFSGATTVNAGVVSVQSSTALGQTTGGTTVTGTGAAVYIDNTAIGGGANQLTVNAEPLALNGSGISGTGALRNFSGNNTFQGLVNVASSTLITSDSGNTLTLSGGLSSTAGTAQLLTIGTTAQNGNITVSGNITNGTTFADAVDLRKDGSGDFTFAGAAPRTGTVGAVNLAAGTMTVGTGNATTLNTAEFESAGGTTLTIGSGAQVVANYGTGTTTFFSGALAGSGTFQKDGAGTLVFDNSFTADSATLILSGGTLKLDTAQITVGTIRITGNTILDFGASGNTFLSSANLIIDNGVTVTVNNWISVANNASASTAWYLRNYPTLNSGGLLNNSITIGGSDILGGPGLANITFTDYNNLTTTWVSGNHSGWFDREIRPTPEPATYGALLIGGCLGLLGWRRWRRTAETRR